MCKVPNEKLNFPEALTDEELCRLVAEGNRQAEEILAARYIRLVRTCARPYFLAGGDSEDLTQEGMLGLHQGCAGIQWQQGCLIPNLC